MASVRLIGLEDPTIDFTFSTNPEKSIDFEGLQKWASLAVPRQEGSILQNMGSDPLMFHWSGVLDGDNAFSDLNILDGIRRQGAPLKFQYAGLAIDCVITSLTFKLASPFSSATGSDVALINTISNFVTGGVASNELSRWFYEIKFQKYYPLLAVSRTAATDASLTGQELSSLSNRLTDLNSSLSTFSQILADIQAGTNTLAAIQNQVMQAVAGVEDSVTNALSTATDTLDQLRQGIQLPAYVLQQTQQTLQDSSTLVKQSVSEMQSILNTPNEILTSMYDMTVSLDSIAASPFVTVTNVTTVVVADGDTLEALAFYFYGSAETWRVIYTANKALLPDPNALIPGITLSIPL